MVRRVVVTGIGLVCAVGNSTEEVWKNLLAGKSGVARITHFDASAHSCQIAAEVKNFDPLNFVEKKELKKMGRFIYFALAASDEAMRASGLEVTPEIAERVGVHIGSGIGGFDVIEREHRALLEGGPRKISPFFIPAAIVNLAAGHVSMRFGAKGPNEATATACTTSAHSIGDSYKIIQRGDAEVMIAGGSEAAITPMGVGGFAAMRALSTRNDDPEKASRPWDTERDGFVCGEGAGILILEDLAFAKRRGAPILAEIVGYGMSGDAYHITQPAPEHEGAYRVMKNALHDAKLQPKDIGYVNAHGTSTPIGDVLEAHAIRNVLPRAQGPGQFHQVDDRPFAGWRRRPGGRCFHSRPARPDPASRPRILRIRIPTPFPWTSSPTTRAKPRSTTRSRTPSASAAPTAP